MFPKRRGSGDDHPLGTVIERPGEEASEEAMAAAAAAAATKAANTGNKARSRAGSIAPGNKSKKKKKGGGGAGVPEIRRVAAQSLAKNVCSVASFPTKNFDVRTKKNVIHILQRICSLALQDN